MRILKWIGLSALLLSVAGALLLALIGLPAPPGVHAKHIDRVTWRSAAAVVAAIREVGGTVDSEGWLTDPTKLWIATGQRREKKRSMLSNAGAAGEAIQEIPPAASSVVGSPDLEHPIIAYLLDEGGSELYRLYTWIPGHHPVAITDKPERMELCCINSTGTSVAFAYNSQKTGLSDVLIADPRNPASVRVIMSQVPGEASPIEWSPDGQRLLIIQWLSFDSMRAFIFDSTTNEIARIVPEWGDHTNITRGTWSKNGQLIYLTSDANADFVRPFELDLTSHNVRPLITNEGHDALGIYRAQGTDNLVVPFDENGETKLYLVDPSNNSLRPLQSSPGNFLALKMHPREPRLVEVTREADGRPAAYVLDVVSNRLEQWVLGDPPPSTPAATGESMTYPTFDLQNGTSRRINVIFKPPTAGFSPPWPVAIVLHGGPAAQSRPEWDPVDSVYQRMGIAILKPNVRGSTGSGREFVTLDDREKREDAVRDVGALLDWIKTRPDLDASRVGVYGGSYGGYMTLAVLVHYSDRLRCGVEMFGIANFVEFLKASEKDHFVDVQRGEYGDERDPKTRSFLDGISPVNHADQITVPILIYQGVKDPRVKVEQSREMVGRLERLGRNVSYIEAANEGHGLENPLDQLYVGSAITDFMRRYLLAPKTKP